MTDIDRPEIVTDDRPEIVTDEHLEYLDALRDSGATNMFGAAPWLRTEFALDRFQSNAVLAYWMATFSQRHSPEAVPA